MTPTNPTRSVVVVGQVALFNLPTSARPVRDRRGRLVPSLMTGEENCVVTRWWVGFKKIQAGKTP